MSRLDQINELLRAELSNMIVRESPLPDGLITITHVSCAPNLRSAKIYISVLPENVSGTALKKLRQHSSSYSGDLKKKLKMKFIPKFNWEIDQQERHAIKINRILDEIHQEENDN